MPLSFILCGVSALYILFYKLNKSINIVLFTGILTICIGYLTKSTQINEYLAINIVALLGVATVMVYCFGVSKFDSGTIFFAMFATLVYCIIVKFNFDYNLILSSVPLCLILGLVFICQKSISGGVACVALAYLLICVSNCFLLRGNQLYYILFDSFVLDDVITICLGLIVLKLVLKAIVKLSVQLSQSRKSLH